MLKIRLQRVGRKHETAYRLVLTDSKNSTKSGRFLEILGSYDPRKDKTDKVNMNADRVKHWMAAGAQATDTVHNLLITSKVIEGKKRNVLPKKTAPVKEVVAEAAPAAPESVPAEETPAEAPTEA